MNFAIVRYLIGWMLGIESIFLLLPALTAVIYGEPELPVPRQGGHVPPLRQKDIERDDRVPLLRP
mgnify:CR=1 FL=1